MIKEFLADFHSVFCKEEIAGLQIHRYRDSLHITCLIANKNTSFCPFYDQLFKFLLEGTIPCCMNNLISYRW
jgi:hypothetical protein